MRIMVTGSREWNEPAVIQRVIAEFGPGDTLVHGGARGADVIAAAAAERQGMKVEEHKARWSTEGRAAGILRNNRMLDADIDLVIAFQKDGSRGTQHAIEGAKLRGIPGRLWRR